MSSSETRGFSELGLTVCFVTPVSTVSIPVTSEFLLPEAAAAVTPELVLAAGLCAWWKISEADLFRFHVVFHSLEQNRALITIFTC